MAAGWTRPGRCQDNLLQSLGHLTGGDPVKQSLFDSLLRPLLLLNDEGDSCNLCQIYSESHAKNIAPTEQHLIFELCPHTLCTSVYREGKAAASGEPITPSLSHRPTVLLY